MNKILFNLLVAGVSFGGIQEASAVKILKDEDGRNVNIMPLKTPKSRATEPKKWIPCAPVKPSQFYLLERRVAEDPENFKIQNGILWKRSK